MKKQIIAFSAAILGLSLSASFAFAHVVVKPNQAGIGAFQTFTIGVPSEKDNPTVALKLLLPEGLGSVSPNVKPGWKIDVKKNGDGEDATVTEIDWTGGSIPAGLRDDFFFSAQVPAKETTLNWKAYQTYQDGSVVSWDQTPDPKMSDDQREAMEKKNMGPLSQTNVVNDLQPTSQPTTPISDTKTPLMVGIVALALAATSLAMQLRKK